MHFDLSSVLLCDFTIESVQRRFTKRLCGMSNLSYTSRLKALSLNTLEHRRLQHDLKMICNDFLVVKVNCWSYVFDIMKYM